MFLSVTIPTYNCAAFLHKTLESVVESTKNLDNFEIVVVDDKSNLDDPKSVVDKFGGVVKFYQQEVNVGVANNFNTCLSIAKGDFIHILHGDDYIDSNFYELMFHKIHQNPNIGLYFCQTQVESEVEQPLWISQKIEGFTFPSRDISSLVYSNHILTPSVIINRKLIAGTINFDPSLSYCTDWLFWVNVISKYGGIQLQRVLAHYRELPQSDSKKAASSGRNYADLLKIQQKFKIIDPLFNFHIFERRMIKEVFNTKIGLKDNVIRIFKELNMSLSFLNIIYLIYMYFISKAKIYERLAR
jgi:glycosyltransferase involved in cell wall biosynthesis